MKKQQRGYTMVLGLIYVAIVLLAAGGWIANIVKLVGMDFSAITGFLVVRVAGIIVPPLGVVMGYL